MQREIFVDTGPLLDLVTKEQGWQDTARILSSSEIWPHTSVVVLGELKYKFLLQSAAHKLGRYKKFEVLAYLKKNPAFTAEVYKKYLAFFQFLESRFTFVDLPPAVETEICALAMRYNLLPNDAAIIEAMLRKGITDILTDDSDFRKVEGIKLI